jgi:hypothetical protein
MAQSGVKVDPPYERARMTKPTDDLDAVRAVVDALEGFDANQQERVIRWAREKLGLASAPSATQPPHTPGPTPGEQPAAGTSGGGATDIKAFVNRKKPSSDNQFAATVAYYYQFEAPPAERKVGIGAEDLQDACRKTGRERLRRPIATLHSAHRMGLLDKVGRGAFGVNSVGENLVAMTLPQDGSASASTGRTRKTTAKKRSPKKTKARR